jgi:hypothetical protein
MIGNDDISEVSKIILSELHNTKLGTHPDSCIIDNPYCECHKGSRCKLLPDRKINNDHN